MVIAILLGYLALGVAIAQDKPADTMDVLREKVRTDKKLVLAAALDLTESEAKGFWPVYNAYQSDMIAHHDWVLRFIEGYASGYQTMTDESAAKLLTDFLSLETKYVDLLKSHRPHFQKVLPAKKVARLYQIENKVRALVYYELAREIPLVK